LQEYQEEDKEGKDESQDFIKEVREKFLLSNDYEKENRELAKEDIEFGVMGKQWDERDVNLRKQEGRPCITINKFPAYIRQVVNDSRQNRPSIKVRPVDDNSDPDTAEIFNGLIRNIETASNADVAYDTAINQAVSCGFGYLRINVEFADDDTFDRQIKIDRISNQFSVYGDPHSTSVDGSDWNCCFVTDRISKEEFEERFGEKAEATDWESDDNSDFEWLNDEGVWIAEYWERKQTPRKICLLSDGDVVDEDVYQENLSIYESLGITKVESRETVSHKVTQYILSGTEVLETNEWAGKYIPIIPVYGEEVILEGKRYFKSLIRDSKDAQKMFNFWRTTSTEVVGSTPKTPFIGEEGAFDVDTHKWNTANVKNWPYLQHKKGTNTPQRQPFASIPAGIIQEAMNASEDLQATMGMFGASIGEQDNAVSGRAINARKKESDTGTFHFIDNLSRALGQAGRIIIDLIPHVVRPGQILRIIGEDRKETTNITVGNRQEMQQQQPGRDLSNIYDLTVGKYDVVVDIGPGYTTKREEAASQMIEFARVNPQAIGLISDLIAKNLDWPGADEIAERFKAMLPPQILGEDPQMQQLQQQMQQMQQQAQQMVGQLQQQMEQLKADKTLESKKIDIDGYNAETNRLKVTQAGMTPEQIQMMVAQTVLQLMQSPDVLPMQQQQFQQPQEEVQQ
jgi:hypothetical protein